MHLKGGPFQFMTDYADRAARNLPLGTWAAFETKLRTGYQQVLPEHAAQQKLAEICSKKYDSLPAFAEKFQQYAPLTGFSDHDLIQRIDQHRSKEVRQHMVLAKSLNPAALPTTWFEYMAYALRVDMELRESSHKSRATTTTATKPDDAMDVDALRETKKPEPMNNEQKEWLDQRKCFRCGKHDYKAGQRCRNPKYKGYYIIPKRETARTVEEGSSTPTPAPATSIAVPVASPPTVTSAGKAELRTFLEFFEAYKSNGGTNPSAHIEAVEEDFMPSL
jgi:hypothetical protein